MKTFLYMKVTFGCGCGDRRCLSKGVTYRIEVPEPFQGGAE